MPRLRGAVKCFVGYSGGLDSQVLLQAAVELLGADTVAAIHVNHQLSPHAGVWQQHCEGCCRELGVELIVETVAVVPGGQGVEDAARVARYQVFKRHLTSGSLLLLAHHADDQVETVLYRLLRGSGPRGLAGMPASRRLGQGGLLRPLLSFTRAELQAYAEQKKLSWVDDESNADTDFDRNFIRHRLLPPLRERWPDYAARIAHSAALCRDNDELAAMLAAQDLIAVYEREERLGWSISVEAMLHLEELRRANLLRHWPEHHQMAPPGHRAVEAALCELLPAREDAEPQVSWGGVQLRRYQRRLYLLPRKMEEKPDLPVATQWALPGTLPLADGSYLEASRERGGGLLVPEGETLEIRYRRGGERCKPFGRSASTTLKKLFQEYSVEPWLRDQVPLIYLDDQLVAVADLWVCDGFVASQEQSGWVIQWCFSG